MTWITRTLIVVALAGLAACGGSPTSPSKTPDKQPAPQAAPEPAPAPAPAPAPDPGPTRIVLHATVETSYWFPHATFRLPEKFDVILEGDTATIASLDPLPFTFRSGNALFIVKTPEFTFSVQNGTFSYSGLAGEATGRIGAE
jgi:hypothetical protein